jgi:hypothetical protein
MNKRLESDLHDAFALRVSGIPGETTERLLGTDYHPRTGRIPARLTAGAVVGAAATTTAVVSVVVLGGSQAAFAGWSPSPESATAAPAPGADASCQAQLAAAPSFPASAGGSWSEVATDVRGPFTLVIYQDGDANATCLTGPSVTAVSRSSGDSRSVSTSQSGSGSGTVSRGSSSWYMGSGSGDFEKLTVAHLASTSQGAYTLVEGQVAADVTGVTLVRSDGEHVQSTTDHGWFLAWWPGAQGVTSALITTAQGVTTQVLNTPPPPPPADGSCVVSPATPSPTTVCSGGAHSGPGAASTGTP